MPSTRVPTDSELPTPELHLDTSTEGHTVKAPTKLRTRFTRAVGVGAALTALLLTAACGGSNAGADAEAGEPVRGGTLKYALGADLPSLDMMSSTAGVVSTVAENVVEYLFVADAKGANVPLLATDSKASEDGKSWTVTLREGVNFHNGDVMAAKDVKASYERWSKLSSTGKDTAKRLDKLETPDEHTLVWHFKEPFGSFLSAISGMPVYPASAVENWKDDQLIGTGPYKVESYEPGRGTRLVRFDQYSALEGDGPDGYGGHKPQYLDGIDFEVVTNEASRLSGLETGQYDLIHGSSADALLTLEGAQGVKVERLKPSGMQMVLVNQKSKITSDQKLRQAIQAALGNEEILTAGLGAGNFRLDPSYMLQETTWHSTVGEDKYNQHNVDKAKQLVAESGYKGETVRLVTSRDLVRFYNQSVVVEQQLEAAGIKAEVETYDWPTALEHRDNENGWELFITDYGVNYDPVEQVFFKVCRYAGWWCDPTAQSLVDQLNSESDPAKRHEVYNQLQGEVYQQVPFIKLGDTAGIEAVSDRVHGVEMTSSSGVLAWNLWLEK